MITAIPSNEDLMEAQEAAKTLYCAACEEPFGPEREACIFVCHTYCAACFTKLVRTCLESKREPSCCLYPFELEEVQHWAADPALAQKYEAMLP